MRRFAWGTDASFYLLIPKTVIRSENEEQVQAVLREASANGTPVTFRAAGTSLSIQSAMMGGIIANNASGMSCGVHANSDRTLCSAWIIFADGSLLDTSDAQSRARWGESHKDIVDGIAAIRDEIRSNPAMETRLMGLGDTIVNFAGLCSTRVVVPEEVGCCGFAGDKGMTHPELNAYALRHLRSAVESAGTKRGYSNSRTCEIGLSENSGIPYSSIVYLVNSHTKAKNQ